MRNVREHSLKINLKLTSIEAGTVRLTGKLKNALHCNAASLQNRKRCINGITGGVRHHFQFSDFKVTGRFRSNTARCKRL